MPSVEGISRSQEEDQLFEKWRQSSGEQKELLLNELVKLLQRHAYAICWLKLGERRPDIVNQAIWQAIKAADGFKGESSFSTWFHAIVKNLCNSSLRHKQRHSKI